MFYILRNYEEVVDKLLKKSTGINLKQQNTSIEYFLLNAPQTIAAENPREIIASLTEVQDIDIFE